MENLLQVGVISSTHGIKGEVKVFPTTDDSRRFSYLKNVQLDMGNHNYIHLEIENVKYFKQLVILKFKGFDNINDIIMYKGKSLFVTREDAVALQKDEYFIADLIGMKVRNEDNTFQAVLKEVMETGANDVYILETTSGKEVLIPAIKDCILDIDLTKKEMCIHLLDGLLES